MAKPMIPDKAHAVSIRAREGKNRSLITSETGRLKIMETPMSPVSNAEPQFQNCAMIG